jgi:hypothetical protein
LLKNVFAMAPRRRTEGEISKQQKGIASVVSHHC